MLYTALSDLHIIPQGRTVTADYYIEEILIQSLLSSLKRKRRTGSVLTRKLLPNMSEYTFQQDGLLLTMLQGRKIGADNI